MLDEPADRAALAGRVAAFEEDGDPTPIDLDIPLQLDELDLESLQLLLVAELDQSFADVHVLVGQQVHETLPGVDGDELVLGQGHRRLQRATHDLLLVGQLGRTGVVSRGGGVDRHRCTEARLNQRRKGHLSLPRRGRHPPPAGPTPGGAEAGLAGHFARRSRISRSRSSSFLARPEDPNRPSSMVVGRVGLEPTTHGL